MTMKQRLISLLLMVGLSTYLVVGAPMPAYAMHIMEGFLPPAWAIFWWGVFLPFFMLGLRSLVRITQANPELKLLLALAGAFTFVLSALKIPSVTGSCSHPTGTGLGAVLFGPFVMSVLGAMVLLFQALLLGPWGLNHPRSQRLFNGDRWPVCSLRDLSPSNAADPASGRCHVSGGSLSRFIDLCGDIRAVGAGLSGSVGGLHGFIH